MKAGRELDCWIAENVMGWSGRIEVAKKRSLKSALEDDWCTAFKNNPDSSMGEYSFHIDRNGNKIYCGKPHNIHFPPYYSIAIQHAWLVVEKITNDFKLDPGFHIFVHSGGFTRVMIDADGFVITKEADTAPLAICLAAKKAMEAKG